MHAAEPAPTGKRAIPRGAHRDSGTSSINAMMFPSLSLNHAAFAPPAVIAPAALYSPGMS